MAPPRSLPTTPPPWWPGVWGVAAGAGVVALGLVAYFGLRAPATPPVASRQEIISPSPPSATLPRQLPGATQAGAAGDAAQQSAAVKGQPDVAPTNPPARAAPVEHAQREAIVMPPVTPSPAPPPQTAPSPLEQGQAAAQSLPCSILNLTDGQDGIRVSGLALAGAELDQLLADLHNASPVTDAITRVDRFACAPILAMKAFVQRSWKGAPPTFAIRLDQRTVASGARLGINVTPTPSALYIDLYQADGSVRHLSRPIAGSPIKPRAEWVAAPPAGPRLVVAISAATSLDLGARPETERASDYLAALRPRLQRAAEPPAVDLVMATVRAVEPAVAKVPRPRATPLRSDRCANIVSRAQLGETLSDAELTALRTECRS